MPTSRHERCVTDETTGVPLDNYDRLNNKENFDYGILFRDSPTRAQMRHLTTVFERQKHCREKIRDLYIAKDEIIRALECLLKIYLNFKDQCLLKTYITRRHSVERIHSPCHKFPLFPK